VHILPWRGACALALIAGIAASARAQTPPACAQAAFVTDCDHWGRFTASLISVGTVASPAASTVLSQVLTSHDGFASDAAGYGHHYAINLIGNTSGKFFGKYLLPTAFHQDDVYIPARSGASLAARIGHISKHLLITSSADHRRSVFNVAALPNSLWNAALSNVYQPAPQRTAGASATRLAYNVAGFVLGDAYEEFKPEIGKLEAALLKVAPWRKGTP
jgi:hypothetical protein